MLISVIVLTYNRCSDLKRCLDSLKGQVYKDNEIIVIDNGSTDKTPYILNNYNIIVMKSEVKNKAYLRNLGLRNAKGEIVAYIDDDAEADPHWLENIALTFGDAEDIGAVGGPTLTIGKQEMLGLYESTKQSFFLDFILHLFNKIVMNGKLWDIGIMGRGGMYSVGGSLPASTDLKYSIFVDILSTCNAAVRRNVAEKNNGFDENFFFNQEDGDFFIRIKKAGYKLIFNPKVKVIHYVNPNKETRASDFLMGRDYGYLLVKHFKPTTFITIISIFANVVFLNSYLLYKAFKKRSVNPLHEIAGFFIGMIQFLFPVYRPVKKHIFK